MAFDFKTATPDTTVPRTGYLMGADSQSATDPSLYPIANVVTREALTANRTYYVRTDGSDSNDGLANTAGGAFLTIQHAVDVLYTLDVNNYDVTINVADGTYNESVLFYGVIIGVGPNTVISLVGNTTTPANCVIDGGVGNAITCDSGASVKVGGFKLVAGDTCLNANNWSKIVAMGKLEFGSAVVHMNVQYFSSISINGFSHTISGSASFAHIYAYVSTVEETNCTITLTGTPAFGYYVYADAHTQCQFTLTTYSGAATGQRYTADANGIIFTNAGENYLPGDAAGAQINGGRYIGAVSGAERLTLTADTTYYVRANLGVVTMTIASPCVVSLTAHGLSNGDAVVFTTSGALPTGLTEGKVYYVVNKATDTFEVSATVGGASINTSGSQSGTHKVATGSDSNDGSAATRASAWLTAQKAADYVTTIDAAGYAVTIKLADSTYLIDQNVDTNVGLLAIIQRPLSAQSFTIQGAASANTKDVKFKAINVSYVQGILMVGTDPTYTYGGSVFVDAVNNIYFQNDPAQQWCGGVYATNYSVVNLYGCSFADCVCVMFDTSASVNPINCQIDGNYQSFFQTFGPGFGAPTGCTTTANAVLTGAFIDLSYVAGATVDFRTWSGTNDFTTLGTTSGGGAIKYNIGPLCQLRTGGVSLPGAAGTLASGGVYESYGPRKVLIADTTYYVRTDGNDANDGLTNTAGGAWLTIQHAINVLYTLDLADFGVTIQVADGTYAEAISFKTVPTGYGSNSYVRLYGNTTTPANVVITSVNLDYGAIVTTGGYKCTEGFQVYNASNLNVTEKMAYGAAPFAHFDVEGNSGASITADYEIVSGAPHHYYTYNGGTIYVTNTITVTLTGTPTFYAGFACAEGLSSMYIDAGITWSGSASGPRYTIFEGSVIANYSPPFPGDSAGTDLNRHLLAADTTYYVRADLGTVTMTIASPCVVSKTAHGLSNNDPVVFTTSGALPTGLTATTVYYVVNKNTDDFQVSATVGGSAINTSGSQSGTHKVATGNDSNDGLAATRAGAWLTQQHAIDQMSLVDANGYGVTIQLADSAYAAATASFCLSILYRPHNSSYFYILGNPTTRANVYIDGVDNSPSGIVLGYNSISGAVAQVFVDKISGITIKNAANLLEAWSVAYVQEFSSNRSDNCTLPFSAYENCIIYETGTEVSGSCSSIFAVGAGGFLRIYNLTFDTGATCSAEVVFVDILSSLQLTATWTNLTGNGQKYVVNDLGSLSTGGGLASIPGTGTTVGTLAHTD